MEYLIKLLLLVITEICRRYLLIFLIGAVVVSLAVGGIAAVAGGAFWVAVKVTLAVCAVVGVIAGGITTYCALN
jgi:hypothetical protein